MASLTWREGEPVQRALTKRGTFVKEHATEIVADYHKLGKKATINKWHVGVGTLRKLLLHQAKEEVEPIQPTTAKDFAAAILEGYTTLKIENYQLKQQVEALQLEIHRYELIEQMRKIEDEQVFQAKVKMALVEPGENQL